MIDFSQPPRSLCLFRLSAIGDVTHILPIIYTLQKHWPKLHITWVIGKLEYDLVKSIPAVEFIVFDKSAGWRALLSLNQRLRGRKFDVLLMMQAALRASIASCFIRAGYKIGFDRQRAIDLQWLFSNHRICANPRVHVLDSFFQFLEAIGIHEKIYRWELPMDPADQDFARHTTGTAAYVVINPCSSARNNNWRNWAFARYSEIADYLDDKGLKVFLTGGPSVMELEFSNSIANHCKSSPCNLAGRTSLGELLAIIQQAEFIIAPDTGPAHMATIVDTPVIGLFASSNPARSGPYKSQSTLVNQYENALMKFKHKSVDQVRWGARVRDPAVMDLIGVEQVKNQIDKLLARRAS